MKWICSPYFIPILPNSVVSWIQFEGVGSQLEGSLRHLVLLDDGPKVVEHVFD